MYPGAEDKEVKGIRPPLLARKSIALPAAFLCCALWGSSFPTVKAGLNFLTPTFFAGARFASSGLILLILAVAIGADFAHLKENWIAVMSIGLLQTVIGYYLFFHGMTASQAVTASIIISSGPIIVALLAYPLLGEGGWTIPQAAGVLIGFLGVVTALIKPGWTPDFSLRGEGLILLSTLAMSFASIVVKKIAGTVDAVLISGGSMTGGGLLLLAAAFIIESPSRQVFSRVSVGLLLYSVFISASTFTLWYALLRHNLVSRISPVKFTIPIVGSLLSAVLLGEKLTMFKAAGVLMVGLGIYLIFFRSEIPPSGVDTGP